MPTTRREFFKLATGTVGAVAGAVGCKTLERGYPEHYEVEKPPVPGANRWAKGEERLLRSVCLQCPGGCGIKVRVVEGRAVKIDGNPDYPTNQGRLCPKGQNGLQVLYDPDRVRGPMRRLGARGQGKWQQISWDEATAEVARQLRAFRTAGQPHTVAFVGGRYRGHMRALVRRFLAAYGSPNDIGHGSLSVGNEAALYLTQGVRSRPAYDWDRTRYVLSFGAGLIESFIPGAMMLRVFGHLRAGTPGQRAKIVQIEPRCGVTAGRADEWVCIKPGTDGALALGLAHVMVRDGLYNRSFVEQHTFGFEPWVDSGGRKHQGFRQLLARYTPEAVAGLTGVPAETVRRLGREFGEHAPAVAVSGGGVAAHTNGLAACLAVHALNALAGSIEAPGGVLCQERPPFAEWAPPEIDEIAKSGAARPRFDLAGEPPPLAVDQLARLAEALEHPPYPINALLFYYTNPLFSAPGAPRLRTALTKVPLLVSFSPFLDETSAMCDLILPDHTYLERWQLDETMPSVGFPVFGVRQPVVEPLHNTRSTGEALIRIARAVGGSLAKSFPKDELELIKDRVRGVHAHAQAAGRGPIKEAEFDEFWKKLLEVGGWWGSPYKLGDWGRVLATPSGKYEFYSKLLEEKLASLAHRRWPDRKRAAATDSLLAELGVAARGDEAFLPHFEPAKPDAPPGRFPFTLIAYKTMTRAEGRGGNQPHLQELYCVQFDRCWEAWVEIHPEDAAALGIKDDDVVVLAAPSGRVKAKAILYDGLCRGVVAMPVEYGHTAYGRWARGRGESPIQLLGSHQDPLVGCLARYDVRVAISKG